jgi:alkanesulfonate monooxygenase SsuD/methylene tetrahydromethanopterin reductase-like flavin-dependent oxidoreductase (luciferase family)
VFIGYFTQNCYIDTEADWYTSGKGGIWDLALSNEIYDPKVASQIWADAFEAKRYIDEIGFDGIMLNEHHSMPGTMRGGMMNLEAAILAQITRRIKICLVGNVTPIWDDPLRLLEELTAIDVISKGRLVSGLIRGTGREAYAHNSPPAYNWERFQEAHDFLIKAWTTPGPFRWEGKHFHYRYVNPFWRPYQQPHPPIWGAGLLSKATVEWAARHRYPYMMLGSRLDLTEQVFDLYREYARADGWEPGTESFSYMMRVIPDETEQLALESARKTIEGPGHPFVEGSKGRANAFVANLPGLNPRTGDQQLGTAAILYVQESRGLGQTAPALDLAELRAGKSIEEENAAAPDYEESRKRVLQGMIDSYNITAGTPEQCLTRIRFVLEKLRPGHVFFQHADGAMTHEEGMRGLRLWAQMLPEIRKLGDELGLQSSFEQP